MLIIVMEKNASEETIDHVKMELIRRAGTIHVTDSGDAVVFTLSGELNNGSAESIRQLTGVARIYNDSKPYRLVSREIQSDDTLIDVRGVRIGGKAIQIIAGPCSVESRSQIIDIARSVKNAGATILRGGAFKPRSSPYSFQGLGEEALDMLAEARELTGLPVVTEVILPADIERVTRYADILQVGSRNSQNIPLLQELGKTNHPVILKRGMMMTIEEWLMAAEYILINGNRNVILCERGIRTFETMTRNTLDVASVPIVKQISHLPLIVDPSHASGRRDIVPALSRAAIASGADGLMIEVHNNPEDALSDGAQAITPETLSLLVKTLQPITGALGRSL
jgi:3-deoxy-7-phosphoheptulonate synthase